jgi:hypothetical protein
VRTGNICFHTFIFTISASLLSPKALRPGILLRGTNPRLLIEKR